MGNDINSFEVVLKSVNDAVLLSQRCSEYDNDIDYSLGKYVVDAKSFLGIMAIGFGNKCTICINTDSVDTLERFKKDINLWISN